jgi:carboxylate-amine ligase
VLPAAALPTLSPDALRAAFDAPAPLTVGLEEELFVCDAATLELVPRARELVAAGAPAKLELPAAQLELATPPAHDVPTAIAALERARRGLLDAAGPDVRFLAAGVHPLAAPEGELNAGGHYDGIREEYGIVAARQLIGALQVHVAVGTAERTLEVHNALRAHLPELAALAANAPFHAGRDTGLASMRPLVTETLPRQGVPPAIPSWEAFAEAMRWGAAAGATPEGGRWWWELRPHPRYGTLELRVPDAQASLLDAGAIAAVAHCLVAWLARGDAAPPAPPAPTWRIEENRWSALRHGVEGSLADLETGERQPTRERLHALLDALGPVGADLGCAAQLARARELVEANGAMRQRAAGGPREAAAWLAEQFEAGAPPSIPAG